MGRGTLTPQEEALKKKISSNIVKLIESNGLSQAEFSRRVGIPPTTISGYVKSVTRPNAGNIQKIADAFNILKSDIDPSFKNGYSIEDWNEDDNFNTPEIQDTISVMKMLEQPRQEKVLSFAKSELKNQEKDKITSIDKDKKVYTEEDFDRMARKAVAFGGGELSDKDIDFLKDYLRHNTDRIKED